jgi:hypothetical protein
MEELHSTEALDREILEDARKKAYKILKTADDTVQSKDRSWEKKTKRAVEGIRKSYAAKTEKLREETLARLPLDKRRLRSESAEAFLREAMDAFLAGLKRTDLLSLLEREFSRRLEAVFDASEDAGASSVSVNGERNPVLFYSALSAREAEDVLKNALSQSQSAEKPGGFGNLELKKDESPGASRFPALVLDTQAVRISASVEASAADLLETRRAELAAALLGEGALND